MGSHFTDAVLVIKWLICLDVVRVSGTVSVAVLPGLGPVAHVADVDGDPAGLLLLSLNHITSTCVPRTSHRDTRYN